MDITNLKTYLEVYRTRHFGKAASNLFVTQSAVSARIRQLEEKLGVRLFTRDRNNIQPTTAGEKFFMHAEAILNAWNRAQLHIALEDDHRTHLVVAGIPSVWDTHMTNWISSINTRFPDVVLSCETVSQDAVFRGMMEGTVDIGITDEPPHRELVSAKNITDNLIMVSSHPDLNAMDAIAADYIYVDWGMSFAAAHAAVFPDAPIPSLRIELSHIALDLINRRGGTLYLPEQLVQNELGKGSLHRVTDAPILKRETHVTYRPGSDRENLIKDILKTCQFNSPSSK